MKKTFILLIAVFTFVLLTHCEKDEYHEHSPITEATTKVKTLTNDDLASDRQFQKLSNTFNFGQSVDDTSDDIKKSNNQEQYFEIDYSKIKKVVNSLGSSYTFSIKPDKKTPETFDNLIVEETSDGNIRGFVMRYTYSERYLDSMKIGKPIAFEGTIQRTRYYNDFKELEKDVKQSLKNSKSTITKGLVCFETTVIVESKCPWNKHSNGQYCHGLKKVWYGYAYQTSLDCISTGSTFTDRWGWTSGSGTYSTTVPDPNVTSGNSYSSTSTVEPTLFDDVSSIQSFVSFYGLQGDEIEWARYRPNRNMVEGFMEENSYGKEARTFIKPAANALVNRGVVDFDDKIILDKSLVEKPCQKDIVKKSYTNYSELANTITSTFSVFNQKNINLTFKNENLTATGQVGRTDIYAEEIINPPYAEPIYNINITFDTDFLETATDLAIAATSIHEQVHAFLVYLHETGKLLVNSTEPGYEELIQAYAKYKADNDNIALATTQHEYMTNLVNEMRDDLYAFVQLNNIQGVDKDYCEKLVWGKLIGTATFQTKFPKFQEDGDYNPDYIEINNATLAEANNENKEYVHSNGNTYLNSPQGSPCN
ncbi:hypothetical protein UMM65_10740 [Aureibaculum sp. 2210JD6-5]|uniref:hypothetical protein n=1 Tax=Aureibaculum sp. 2210JD6-5 TaxID=3103957 RepID=UPI002AACBA03|nr:hypothetical protein [Aureibaculum sp. 2210JD6-5]MDY7395721.1 hypothetical protein [Aureibaculum sp. 2210JD6-5]